MLRQALKNARPVFQPLLGARPFSSVPKVSDVVVRFTVIDQGGHRHSVRGLEGSSLATALKQNCPSLDQEVFFQQPLSNEEGGYDTHVTLTNDLIESLPPATRDEKDTLWECGKDLTMNSRLASMVTLSGEMNGMTVAVGNISPWKTL